MAQSGAFSAVDEHDVEMMKVVYSREAKQGAASPEGSSEEDDDEDDDEGAWSVGVCKGWLAQIVESWVGLPGESLNLGNILNSLSAFQRKKIRERSSVSKACSMRRCRS